MGVAHPFEEPIVAKDEAEADRAFATLSAGGPGRHAARQRSLGAVLREVRGPLRRPLDGEPAGPGLTGRAARRGSPALGSHAESV